MYYMQGKDAMVYAPLSLSMNEAVAQIQGPQDVTLRFFFAIHSQYTIEDVGTAYMGGLQNNDYQVGVTLGTRFPKDMHLRLKLFHQSSHFGDDYIIRENECQVTPRFLNHEELSLRAVKQIHGWQLQAETGLNITPHTNRERLRFQVGAQHEFPSKLPYVESWVAATHLQWSQQNHYTPERSIGYGVRLGSASSRSLIILLEAYRGHYPYSTLEPMQVSLLGLGLYLPLN